MAARLTALPGASKVFRGGVTVYTNAAKSALLGVSPALLEEKGAVSREVAEDMARRVREKLGADLGLAVTGLAGPEGDGVHPVGTVFLALTDGARMWVRELHQNGNRERVRLMAGHNAFHMVLEALKRA